MGQRMGVCLSLVLTAWVAVPVRAQVGVEGASFAAAGTEITIGVARLGRGADRVDARDGDVVQSERETRIARADGVHEWWRTLPVGLEQGVTFERRLPGEGPLVVEVATEGAVPVLDGRGGATLDVAGRPALSYGALVVIDATGRVLPSALRVSDGRLLIETDDRGAVYPVVVDPIVLTLERTFGDTMDSGFFGRALSFSDDGTRLAVGAPGENAVYVYRRTGTSWSMETVMRGAGANQTLGNAVELSADGSVALVADGAYNTYDGAIEYWTRSGTTWTFQWRITGPFNTGFGVAAALSANGQVAAVLNNAQLYLYSSTQAPLFSTAATGLSVTLSADGSRVAVGGRVWARAGATWSMEASTLGSGVVSSLSADGSRLAVSSLTAGSVYVRTGTTWAVEGTLVVGQSIAISDDGTRVIVGGTGRVDLFVRSGSTWSNAVGLASAEAGYGRAVAIPQTGTRVAVGAPLVSTMTTANSGIAHVYTALSARGTACTVAAECDSAACADGVCCDVACGGSATNDCQACSTAAGGTTNGTCTALSSARAAGVTCRPAAAGGCDVAEVCSASSTTCPPDAFSSAVCRPAAGPCDTSETCPGTGPTCPGDAFLGAATVCRPSASACDLPDACDGLHAACPVDAVQPSGHVCNPRDTSSECDVEDVCDGTGTTCPPRFAPTTTACGPAVSGVCDAPDHCSGTSGDCVDVYLSGVECRPTSGACDPAELCLGDATTCPPDQLAPAATVCRASSDTCDPAESCDGLVAACPADVSSCTDTGTNDAGPGDAGALDAGSDAGAASPDAARPDAAAIDASAGTDSGPIVPPPATAGCGCAAGAARTSFGPLATLALWLAARRRRR